MAELKRTKLYIPASEVEFKARAGEIMKRNAEGQSEKVFERRFLSFFGIELLVVAKTWELLQVPASPDNPELNGAKLENLLWALLFLKKYGDESEMAELCGGLKGAVDKKTFWKWSRIFVERMAGLILDVSSGSIENGETSSMIVLSRLIGPTVKSTCKGPIQSPLKHTSSKSPVFAMS